MAVRGIIFFRINPSLLFSCLLLPFMLVLMSACVSTEDIMNESKILKTGTPEQKVVAAKKLTEYGSDSVRELTDLTKYENPDTRRLAIKALGDIGDSDGIPAMVAGLGDENTAVRDETVNAFRKVKSDGFPSLRNGLAGSWNKNARMNALMLITEQNDRDAVPFIIPMLSDPEKDLQSKAADTLVKFSPDSVQPLVDALQNITESAVPNFSAILEKIGEPSVVPLVAAMKSPDWQTQERSIRILGKLKSDKALEPLIDIFSDDDLPVREAAADAVGNYRERAIPILKKRLEVFGPDEFIERETITLALGHTESPAAMELLKGLSQDKELVVRVVAARALAINRGDESKNILKKLLSDKNWQVRRRAAAALKATGWKPEIRQEELEFMLAEQDWLGLVNAGKDSFGVLQIALNDDSSWVRKSAANTIAQIKDLDAVQLRKMAEGGNEARNSLTLVLREKANAGDIPLLKNLVSDKDWRNRKEAVSTLGGIRSEEAIDILVKAFPSETEPLVRKSIVDSLGEQNNPKTISILTSAANDSNWMVRKAAMSAIAATDSFKDISQLEKLLYDNSQIVRNAAAATLVKKGWKADTPLKVAELAAAQSDWKKVVQQKEVALPALAQIIKSESESDVRVACVECVGKIGSKDSMQYLSDLMLNDKDPAVKRTAAENLRAYGPASVKLLVKALDEGDMYTRKVAADQLGELKY